MFIPENQETNTTITKSTQLIHKNINKGSRPKQMQHVKNLNSQQVQCIL